MLRSRMGWAAGTGTGACLQQAPELALKVEKYRSVWSPHRLPQNS